MPHQKFSFTDFQKTAQVEKVWQMHVQSASWLGVQNASNAPSIVALIAKNGDLATTKMVEDIRARCADLLLNSPVSVKPTWNDATLNGPRVNVATMLQGKPRAFGRFERQPKRAPKVLTVYVPIGGIRSRSAEEISCSSVAGIITVDMLEAAGYRCEVWGASCADGDYGPQQIRTLLKEAHDPADINAISRVAHPVVFRGLMLSLRTDHGGNSTSAIDPKRFDDNREGIVVVRHSYSEAEVVDEVKRALLPFTGGC